MQSLLGSGQDFEFYFIIEGKPLGSFEHNLI
jgi:hypothetical protein